MQLNVLYMGSYGITFVGLAWPWAQQLVSGGEVEMMEIPNVEISPTTSEPMTSTDFNRAIKNKSFSPKSRTKKQPNHTKSKKYRDKKTTIYTF